jgi:hypothetical protein
MQPACIKFKGPNFFNVRIGINGFLATLKSKTLAVGSVGYCRKRRYVLS